MALAGACQSFWLGEQIEETEAAGVRVKFGTAKRAVTELDTRIARQLAETNRRLYELERAVLRPHEPRDEE